jgi:GntR family transcriptional regulator/MocR family aminotransferase
MFLKLDSDGALYDQIYRALRGQILGGRLAAAARVPATRDLALDLGVSRNVAIMAYRQLLDEGYLTTRKGAGTFVARELPRHLTTAVARQRPRSVRTVAPVHLSAYARRVPTLRMECNSRGRRDATCCHMIFAMVCLRSPTFHMKHGAAW